MFKKIILFLIALISACLISDSVRAATLTPGPLTITYPGEGSIFSESNLSPGAKIRKELTVTNGGRISHNFAIATSNVSGELGPIITLSAIEGENVIWTDTLLELQNLSSGSKFVASLSPRQTKVITLEANFPSSSDSSFAEKNVNFDMVYGTEEAEPVIRTLGAFTSSPTATASEVASTLPAANTSTAPSGEVKGESTSQDEGINPWFLLIAPVAVFASVIFLPEFAIASGITAVSGGVAYVLGYSSQGDMDPVTFYIVLIAEIIILVVLGYFMLHHDNRASRRIKNYHHRLRLR